MGCGASIDAGQIDRNALIPNRVPTLPTHKSPESGSQISKGAPEKGRQGGVKKSSEAAPGAAEWFTKGEATVALVLGAYKTLCNCLCKVSWLYQIGRNSKCKALYEHYSVEETERECSISAS
jgi:hypothetical protein